MSDQGMFQRNINSDGSAAQGFSNPNPLVFEDIDSTTSVAFVDTSGGDKGVNLPDQLSSAGMRITVVNVDGGGVVRVFVQTGDSLNGVVNQSGEVAANAYASDTFVSTGASWVQSGVGPPD